MTIGSFSLLAPRCVMHLRPPLPIMYNYIAKIWHVCLWSSNKVDPIRLGGGGGGCGDGKTRAGNYSSLSSFP